MTGKKENAKKGKDTGPLICGLGSVVHMRLESHGFEDEAEIWVGPPHILWLIIYHFKEKNRKEGGRRTTWVVPMKAQEQATIVRVSIRSAGFSVSLRPLLMGPPLPLFSGPHRSWYVSLLIVYCAPPLGAFLSFGFRAGSSFLVNRPWLPIWFDVCLGWYY